MNFIKKIIEDLKNPKKRSVTLLGLYMVFFIIVAILFRSMPNEEIDYEPPKEITYEYKYTYEIYENDEYVENNDIKYDYDTIEKLIENSDSQTTYKDSSRVLYNISADKYFNTFEDTLACTNLDCADISIPIEIEKEENTVDVTIDLSNYYNHKYIVKINYYVVVGD